MTFAYSDKVTPATHIITHLSPLDDADLFTAEREQQIDDQSTTLVFNQHRSLNLAAQREKLPIKRYKNEILYCLENFQTLVIVGELTLYPKVYRP